MFYSGFNISNIHELVPHALTVNDILLISYNMDWKVISPMDIDAITFDHFLTLCYPDSRVEEDTVYPILRSLERKLDINKEDFLRRYEIIDKRYRKDLKETLQELLLDNLILDVLVQMGKDHSTLQEIVKESVDEGLATRTTVWYPGARESLVTLREIGYKLALISNTHWRWLASRREEVEEYFDIITLSYEHGFAKPHPSIFLVTSEKLGIDLERCLHVGDDPWTDIHGAKQVGMKTVFVRRDDRKTNADLEIENLSDLIHQL